MTSILHSHMEQKRDVELVFVLGHPEYYPRYGFTPAGEQGFEAPNSIPEGIIMTDRSGKISVPFILKVREK